ncbi:spore germination protein GerPB [Neobacillus niacini]|jgi:spore germination protein PB|uniref:spore germination protein GerPB n=1 Tax=Neobacillus niacini TaxID=86668 RepID=UPI00203FE4C9|nr:spore germination protein GerPB [Neobacillus niacini]MCM3690247.1 spore germination protein GerPB [Neobacillus niacini]
MNFYIQQSIQINFIKINSITNSSVLQIGSAGIIKPASYLYNTGGFKGPAPSAGGTQTTNGQSSSVAVPLSGAGREEAKQ